MQKLDSNSSEYYKNQIFVDLSLRYPWNKRFDINKLVNNTSVKDFITDMKFAFDSEIFGMDTVKNEIMNIVCKFITNPKSNRNNIALCGPAGVGKSKFIKILSNIFQIPMKVISLGGIKDSSFFLGHGYVYVESGPGKILQNIIDSKISNPIIYFDELDKVSETEHGKDIHAFLSYLTDATQNTEFTDHYFYGMKFDVSHVFFIFTFNDISKINKILLDRLNVIHVPSPSHQEICTILQQHCIPEIASNIGLTKKVTISKNQIEYIIRHFQSQYDKDVSSGVREYYRILEKILLQVNKDILLENNSLPLHNDPIALDDTIFHEYIKNIEQGYIQQTSTTIEHMYI
jgi:ATP-dependent Lon protease